MARPSTHVAFCAAAAAVLLPLSACGTVSNFQGSETGASNELEAHSIRPDDPLARPTQVAWTSARASRCGFIFSPEQLRANYLASESRYGYHPNQMNKIEKAYDYTRESVLDQINKDPTYCSKDRLDAIRVDLNRYLVGNYRANARMVR